MNPIDQAIIEANVRESLEQSGQVGRVKKTVLTFNGDRTGKTVVGDDYFTYVRLYSAVAPETITKAAVMTIGGAVEYTADAFTITELSGTGYAISINSIIGILVVPEDCDFAIAGTYAATNCDGAPTTSTEFYTSCIETETIHPIDQKFIPGAPFKIRFSEWGFSENNSTFIKNGYFEIPQELRDKFVQTCVSSDPIILIDDAYPTEPISLPAIQIMPYEYADDGTVASWGAIFEERGIAGVLIVLRVSTTNNTDGKASCIVESVSTQTASVSTEGAE